MFEGFTQETSEFLWELSFHNERPWFLEHKEQFERCLNEPFKALAAETVERMQERWPERAWRAHCSRIYRDARRLFGRGPYKDHLWFIISDNEGHYSEGPMFWFEISAAMYEYGMGYFDATPTEMDLFRRTVDLNPARFARLAEEAGRMRGLCILGEEYKRPKGSYEKPIADWYNRRTLGVEWKHDFGGDALRAELPEKLARAYGRLLPLYDYFMEVHRAAAETEERETRR